MSSTNENVGLKFWSDGTAGGSVPSVDIVAVQGLGADPYWTWVKKISSSSYRKPKGMRERAARFLKSRPPPDNTEGDGITEVMWIRDLLVPTFKDARIATYSYKSDWRDRGIKTSLRQCAEQFLNILSQHRQEANEQKRPLLLIGHSLGGLVIEQALVIAVHQQDFTDLRLSVSGIIFLGAPFQGSDVAGIGTSLANTLGLDSTILELLQKDSPHLHALSRDFGGSYSKYDMVCFYEALEAQYGWLKAQIVSAESSSLPEKRMISLDTNHSGLNKFSGADDENYILVLPEIQRMVRNGGSFLKERNRHNNTNHNKHWKVPRSVNPLFTGRAELLNRIQAVLCNDHNRDKQKRFVITGLGGLGKSEICLQIANKMRDHFWGIFWVDVDKPSTAEREFISIAANLGRSVETVGEAIQVLATSAQSWLLILDNADDRNFDYQVYFPPGNHGAVIMTSRVTECKDHSPDAFELLEGLELEASTELLLRAADLSPELWPSLENQAKAVVSLLGSHTLALIQAGAYIREGHCQLQQYPKVYEKQRQRLLKFPSNQIRPRYFNVYATFEASADFLQESRKSGSESAGDALRLLQIMSMLASSVLPLQIFEVAWHDCKEISPDFTEDICKLSQLHVSRLPNFMVPEANAWDSFRLTTATSLLVSLSLVTRHDLNGHRGISMHPLTHAWAKDRQDSKNQGRAWVVTGCVLTLCPFYDHFWGGHETLLLPHVFSYLDIAVSEAFELAPKEVVLPIFIQCGWKLQSMRQYSRLEQLLTDIFSTMRTSPSEPSEEFLELYLLRFRILVELRADEAIELLKQAVDICKTNLPETHLDRFESDFTLGIAYRVNGQFDEAIALLEQLIKIQATILPKTHPRQLKTQHVLATAYLANGQVNEAIVLLEQVVEIQATTLPRTHLDRLVVQEGLAGVYYANGQVDEALVLLEQVVNIEATTLPKTHPNRLASQHALAVAYYANGQVDEALVLLEQVVNIKATTLPETDPIRLASEESLAICKAAKQAADADQAM